jgi:SAM-dependent methyltransferase
MTEQTKATVRREFGANAAAYVTSATHAKGASLERLLALTNPQPDWQVLDIATGAGHTAFLFAPHVRQVWATDITPEMLDQVRQHAPARGVDNLVIELADAEKLPYADGTFRSGDVSDRAASFRRTGSVRARGAARAEAGRSAGSSSTTSCRTGWPATTSTPSRNCAIPATRAV